MVVTPNPIFIDITPDTTNNVVLPNVELKKVTLPNLYIAQYISANINANIKFMIGPAIDTNASPFSIDIFLE